MKDLHVSAERIARWLDGFQQRHGGSPADRPLYTATPDLVTVFSADGSVAAVEVPFPPLAVDSSRPYGGLLDHATRNRRVGVVLVRRGGYAAGVFDGATLVASKVGSRLVQGRTAAGGWSQRRFSRRREKQAKEAFEAAADVVARVVLPYAETLDAIVPGGDREAVRLVLDDPRLRSLRDLLAPIHLNVPDPRLAVLRKTPEQFRAVHIRLTEAEAGGGDETSGDGQAGEDSGTDQAGGI